MVIVMTMIINDEQFAYRRAGSGQPLVLVSPTRTDRSIAEWTPSSKCMSETS
jgi:hypothetical protein